jgi:hypothetical protein
MAEAFAVSKDLESRQAFDAPGHYPAAEGWLNLKGHASAVGEG